MNDMSACSYKVTERILNAYIMLIRSKGPTKYNRVISAERLQLLLLFLSLSLSSSSSLSSFSASYYYLLLLLLSIFLSLINLEIKVTLLQEICTSTLQKVMTHMNGCSCSLSNMCLCCRILPCPLKDAIAPQTWRKCYSLHAIQSSLSRVDIVSFNESKVCTITFVLSSQRKYRA